MNIRIDKCSDSLYWYANRIGETFPVQRHEINRRPDQGIPGDVYWCRTGDTYNTLNYVLCSDATQVPECPAPSAVPIDDLITQHEEHRARFIARFQDTGILDDPKHLAILADISETQSPREVFARRKADNPAYSVSDLVTDLVSIVWDLSFHIEAEQIWREMEAKTPEQIDAELRAAGIDPKAAVDKAWARFQEAMVKVDAEKKGGEREASP